MGDPACYPAQDSFDLVNVNLNIYIFIHGTDTLLASSQSVHRTVACPFCYQVQFQSRSVE